MHLSHHKICGPFEGAPQYQRRVFEIHASGLFAMGEDGVICKLDLEGRVLWIDMSSGRVAVSRARIATVTLFTVSPSGKYVLTLRDGFKGELIVGMYRL